jgi:hypothetical protein
LQQTEGHIREDTVHIERGRSAYLQPAPGFDLLLHALAVNTVLQRVLKAWYVWGELPGIGI